MKALDTVTETANALMHKNLVPQHTLALFKSQDSLKAAAHNYIKEPIKEYSCTICGIKIRGPREYIRQHHKQCSKATPYHEKLKENESLSTRFQAYLK